jgi:hypothetical protein
MSYLSALLLVMSAASPASDTPPPATRNLMPDFVIICMKHGMTPQSVIEFLDSAPEGVIRIPDPHPEDTDPDKIIGFLVNFPDHSDTVIVKASGMCAVHMQGDHGDSSVAAFEKYVLSTSVRFDVSRENFTSTDHERIVSSYILADKEKRFRMRFTLTVFLGESPDTLISWTFGRY